MTTLIGDDISVNFAGVRALANVGIAVRRGEILGLIGPNGAGKTTLVNVLSGFQRADSGTVELDGKVVTSLKARGMARRGVVRTFQSVRLFEKLTVHENAELGAVAAGNSRKRAKETASDLLARFGLSNRSRTEARALPHGEARLLGIVRALAGRPRILMLDEPAAGLNEAEVRDLSRLLRQLPSEFGCGILIIEHDMRIIMDVCAQIQVLDHGQTITVGTPSEVRTDPRVVTAYLGPRSEND
jgi:branched-chain amino acid transport system ATP-binding protein